MEILPNGTLIDKITTYDDYLESDEMARKRTVYNSKEDDEDCTQGAVLYRSLNSKNIIERKTMNIVDLHAHSNKSDGLTKSH